MVSAFTSLSALGRARLREQGRRAKSRRMARLPHKVLDQFSLTIPRLLPLSKN